MTRYTLMLTMTAHMLLWALLGALTGLLLVCAAYWWAGTPVTYDDFMLMAACVGGFMGGATGVTHWCEKHYA